MGHEFLEMKNTPAAVRAYRKAVGTLFFAYSFLWVNCFIPRNKCQRLQGVVRLRPNL